MLRIMNELESANDDDDNSESENQQNLRATHYNMFLITLLL